MLHRFETIDSTSTYLKSLADAGAEAGTAVVALSQTGGRGRLGRSFHSPSGGLYLSYLLRPNCAPQKLMHLTCAAAVAACDAVEAACGFRPGIKWTNDLVFGKQKLGGILTELGFEGGSLQYAIIGIGINCTQKKEDFPTELQTMATSLSSATGHPVSREALEHQLLTHLSRLQETLLSEKEALMQRYRANCITLGQCISVVRGDECYHAAAIDLDDDGALVVRTDDGQLRTVASGEVSIRGMYGYI